MHPLRHPRNAALVGIIFVVIARRLLGRPDDRAADSRTTSRRARRCCSSSGVAMAIMAYVLVAGSSDE